MAFLPLGVAVPGRESPRPGTRSVERDQSRRFCFEAGSSACLSTAACARLSHSLGWMRLAISSLEAFSMAEFISLYHSVYRKRKVLSPAALEASTVDWVPGRSSTSGSTPSLRMVSEFASLANSVDHSLESILRMNSLAAGRLPALDGMMKGSPE